MKYRLVTVEEAEENGLDIKDKNILKKHKGIYFELLENLNIEDLADNKLVVYKNNGSIEIFVKENALLYQDITMDYLVEEGDKKVNQMIDDIFDDEF